MRKKNKEKRKQQKAMSFHRFKKKTDHDDV